MYGAILKTEIMATKKITDLRMEPADNGFIVRFGELQEKDETRKNTYDHCGYDYKTEVFEDPDKALVRFKELWGKTKSK